MLLCCRDVPAHPLITTVFFFMTMSNSNCNKMALHIYLLSVLFAMFSVSLQHHSGTSRKQAEDSAWPYLQQRVQRLQWCCSTIPAVLAEQLTIRSLSPWPRQKPRGATQNPHFHDQRISAGAAHCHVYFSITTKALCDVYHHIKRKPSLGLEAGWDQAAMSEYWNLYKSGLIKPQGQTVSCGST